MNYPVVLSSHIYSKEERVQGKNNFHGFLEVDQTLIHFTFLENGLILLCIISPPGT